MLNKHVVKGKHVNQNTWAEPQILEAGLTFQKNNTIIFCAKG